MKIVPFLHTGQKSTEILPGWSLFVSEVHRWNFTMKKIRTVFM